MKEWLAVVNPSAGGGKAGRTWPEVEKILQAMQIDFDYLISESRQHTISAVRKEINAGRKKWIAIGGDGTLNSLINALFLAKSPTTDFIVALIPVGTGNDWIKTHSIPNSISKAAHFIRLGKTCMHDVGLLQKDDGACQYFINVAGCAFQGFVAERIEVKNKKLKLGKAGFLLGIADALFRYQSFPVSVNSDDRQMENTVFNLSCGICRYAGGGMKLTPAAIPDDGLLDITIAQDFTRLEVVQKIFGLYNGTFVRHKKVIQWRCGSLAVSSSQPLAIETDGEFFGYGNFKISIIPSSIQMIVSK